MNRNIWKLAGKQRDETEKQISKQIHVCCGWQDKISHHIIKKAKSINVILGNKLSIKTLHPKLMCTVLSGTAHRTWFTHGNPAGTSTILALKPEDNRSVLKIYSCRDGAAFHINILSLNQNGFQSSSSSSIYHTQAVYQSCVTRYVCTVRYVLLLSLHHPVNVTTSYREGKMLFLLILFFQAPELLCALACFCFSL